jgi:DHA1 family tetracycline resistance protein-like MFS transporter
LAILGSIRKEKQIFYLALSAAFRGLRDNLRFVIWQPFALSLGVSMSSIGALESLMDVAKTAVQPVFGAASDTYGRKRFLIFRDALIVVAGVCFLFAKSFTLLAIGMTLIGFSVALIPVWSSIVAESASGFEMGMIYSLMGSSYMALGLIGTLSGGYLASILGYSIVYIIFTVLGILSLLLLVFKVSETHRGTTEKHFTIETAVKSFLDAFRPPRYLWGYYIAMSVDLFAFSLGWRLLNGMLTESYGYTPYMLGVMNSVSFGMQAIAQIFLGRHVDRVGYVKYLALSQSISCLVIALIIWNPSFVVVVAANFLMGIGAALWSPAEQAWMARNVETSSRGKLFGGFNTFRGLIALPAPIIGGVLYDISGFHLPLLINLVLAAIDVGLLLFLVKETVRPDIVKTESKLVTGDA